MLRRYIPASIKFFLWFFPASLVYVIFGWASDHGAKTVGDAFSVLSYFPLRSFPDLLLEAGPLAIISTAGGLIFDVIFGNNNRYYVRQAKAINTSTDAEAADTR